MNKETRTILQINVSATLKSMRRNLPVPSPPGAPPSGKIRQGPTFKHFAMPREAVIMDEM